MHMDVLDGTVAHLNTDQRTEFADTAAAGLLDGEVLAALHLRGGMRAGLVAAEFNGQAGDILSDFFKFGVDFRGTGSDTAGTGADKDTAVGSRHGSFRVGDLGN